MSKTSRFCNGKITGGTNEPSCNSETLCSQSYWILWCKDLTLPITWPDSDQSLSTVYGEFVKPAGSLESHWEATISCIDFTISTSYSLYNLVKGCSLSMSASSSDIMSENLCSCGFLQTILTILARESYRASGCHRVHAPVLSTALVVIQFPSRTHLPTPLMPVAGSWCGRDVSFAGRGCDFWCLILSTCFCQTESLVQNDHSWYCSLMLCLPDMRRHEKVKATCYLIKLSHVSSSLPQAMI